MSTVVQQGVFVGFPNRNWQAVTHSQLLQPIEIIREHFAKKAEDLRKTILKDVGERRPPLGISLHPPISIFPLPQKFEYCLGLWHKGLVELLKHCFYAFLQIAVGNLSLVIGDPVVWAYGHAHALLMQELEISDKPEPDKFRPGGKLLRARLWVKAFFDPPNDPDPEMLKSIEGFEERVFRTNWRAPRCLWSFADPRILCDEARDWERLDQETTEQLLDDVVSRFLRGVELRLQEEARAASIGTATQGIPALANAAKSADLSQPVPAATTRPKLRQLAFRALDDYRTICFKGKTYQLTKNQSVIVKILHEAHIAGTPAVGKDTLLKAIEAETSRVRYSFKNSRLWGSLIVAGGSRSGGRRGTYWLNLK